ncbi:MAG: hypothetical protein WBP45_14800 [Daejeonella sp.]
MPVITITITSTTQRLTGSASVPLALASDLNINTNLQQTFDYNICYQLLPGGPVTPFAETNYSTGRLTEILTTFAISNTKTNLAPGTYKVGFGVRNDGGNISIAQSDWLNGWVMLTQ